MPYEVFLSYKRSDERLSDKVLEVLNRRLGYSVYRDLDDLGAGHPWRDQLREVLTKSDLQPYVVVLCTRAAMAEPRRIADEIRLARSHGLTIIPIEFDPGASKAILAAAGYRKPGRIQYIDAVAQSAGPILEERLEDALRRALTRRVRQRLERHRLLTNEWVERLRPSIFF
jgi:hypothetical protein